MTYPETKDRLLMTAWLNETESMKVWLHYEVNSCGYLHIINVDTEGHTFQYLQDDVKEAIKEIKHDIVYWSYDWDEAVKNALQEVQKGTKKVDAFIQQARESAMRCDKLLNLFQFPETEILNKQVEA
ncbi:MAG TPA: hypothetical protein VL443_30010 [Cyclobacteriaceae bacterium]|jgi:hypothetical protein|nr:hypothetical protein [Cyclobacteriaceae bacterium]